MSAPNYRRYRYNGHDEFCLCLGFRHSRQILIIPPLFDEMNRVRRMLVQAMRDLDARGVGSMLLDLPGCNESMMRLEEQSLESWGAAVAACAEQLGATHIASLRGGALVDTAPALPHWRLAPVKGSSILKTMIRTRIASEKEAGKALTEAELMASAETIPLELGGHVLGPEMVTQLATAEAAPCADLTERKLGEEIVGAPLWLRAEPGDDAVLSASIAADLDRWSV